MNKMINTKRAKSGASRKGKYTRKQISEAIQKWTRVLESMDEAEVEPDFLASDKYDEFYVSECHPLATVEIRVVAPFNGLDQTCIICPYDEVASRVARIMYDCHDDGYFANDAKGVAQRQTFINELKENTKNLSNLVKSSNGIKPIEYRMNFTTIDKFDVIVTKLEISEDVSDLFVALNS